MGVKKEEDKIPYTDYHTKHCPHCGEEFFSTLWRERFCESKCRDSHYSLLQYSLYAQKMKARNLPTARAWCLRARERLNKNLLEEINIDLYKLDSLSSDQLEEAIELINYPPLREVVDVPDGIISSVDAIYLILNCDKEGYTF